ncbi:MAG: hypothetical protein M3Y42_00125 [Actinomycetota bacterium]|nr:hypothetical protein [Actinomycetota bacterium]MDQ2955360.1 hypothetical protein [Actinomycetota bacterium]
MSTLSDYLNQQLPDGWQKPQLVEAMLGKLDRATVYKYLAGNHPQNPHDSVLRAFASVLPGVTIVQLRAAANQPVGIEAPWIPPLEANRLTPAQRKALEALIKTMVAPVEDLVATAPRRELQPAEDLDSRRELQPADDLDLRRELQPAEDLDSRRELQPAAAEVLVSVNEQVDLIGFLDQLHSSGRPDLADQVAASLVISSASETASNSSKD